MIPNIKHFMVNGCTFSLVHIPGGEFLMGDDQSEFNGEKPAHRVRLSDFYLGQFPVTQGLWKAVMGGNNPSFFKGDNRPVEQVSWDRITREFLPVLKDLTGISFRLPTEAEWEYAARGGPYWQDGFQFAGSDKLREVGWFVDNGHVETKPVGLKWPNQLGLYDMVGNIREWCQDWYSGDFYEECRKQGLVYDERGPRDGIARVLRGGSVWYSVRNCRVAYRFSSPSMYVYRGSGFRLAASFQSISV